MGEWSLAGAGGSSCQPFRQVSVNLESPLVVQREGLIGTDRREPKFVAFVFQLLQNPPPEPFWIAQRPQPDVGIKEQPQSRRTSQSSSLGAGETALPLILIAFLIDPIHDERSSTEVGGTTSATGFPKRVTR